MNCDVFDLVLLRKFHHYYFVDYAKKSKHESDDLFSFLYLYIYHVLLLPFHYHYLCTLLHPKLYMFYYPSVRLCDACPVRSYHIIII